MSGHEVCLSLLPAVRSAESRAIDVVAFGESSLDFVGVLRAAPPFAGKRQLRSFDERFGGQAATAAVACARQGMRARFIGSFGDDTWGDRVVGGLASEGVDVLRLTRTGARSRIAVVLVDPSGERRIFEHRDSALTGSPDEAVMRAVSDAGLLLVDATDLAASVQMATAARAAGVRTVVDVDTVAPGIDALLNLIDVIVAPAPFVTSFGGRDDVGAALGQMAQRFSSAVLVATLGESGSLALADGRELRTPGFRVDVVDTTGAGDAFRGGLASAWLRGGRTPDLTGILEAANATAALNCRQIGAQTALPTLDEVRALVTQRTLRRSN